MTIAICVACGSIKHGAFIPCQSCGKYPESESDVAYSLALTDHYFSIEVLQRISADMLDGSPRPSLPREQEEEFRDAARAHIARFGALLKLRNSSTAGAHPHSGQQDTEGQVPRTGIRIHPRGQGRSTNNDLVHRLAQFTPLSCRKAEDVLVATKRYAAGPGFFSSRRSLIQKLQREIYALKGALLDERYEPELARSSSAGLMFSYLSEFSDAYPNWQPEYEVLNKFIPMCFDS